MQKLATFPNCWRKIMRKCGVNGTTWLSLSSISNLLDLWWENFKFPNMLMHRDTDVEMSNLYSWFCEDAKEGDEGGVNDIQGKGRRGRPVWQLIRAQSSQTESFLVGCPFRLTLHALQPCTYTFKNCHVVSLLNILKACKTTDHLRTI